MEPAGKPIPPSEQRSADPRAHYPLPEALTRRVTGYLDFFRLFITVALGAAYLSGATAGMSLTMQRPMVLAALGCYLLAGLALLGANRRRFAGAYPLAKTALLIDVGFFSLLYVLFGGMAGGLGVLLVFVSAAAAILLPLRLALFVAALATIVLVGAALPGVAVGDLPAETLVSAGLYGITSFLTAILVHLLAIRARDYRLIAERQQRTLTRLEQINELIIRRMRGGVLAVDEWGEIRMMNESAWFLLGNPASTDRVLSQVSPELHAELERWRGEPRGDVQPLTLRASQALVMPKFVTLPGRGDIRVLIFLEDSDVVAQRAFELAGKSLARLSGSVAHEIRNPLAAVSHAAQLLDEADGLAAPDKRLVAIIRKQARRMNEIVENILRLSRREKSRPDLFDLGEWLTELAEEFRATYAEREVHLACELPAEEVMVMFDRSQLHQALWNLLENAAEYAGREPMQPEVILRLEPRAEAGYCVISVEDNGPGIAADQLAHIFEPFFTTRPRGSGLGLFVARQLCEANQAELTVDSTPGWKTRFHVRLAMAEPAAMEAGLDEALRQA